MTLTVQSVPVQPSRVVGRRRPVLLLAVVLTLAGAVALTWFVRWSPLAQGSGASGFGRLAGASAVPDEVRENAFVIEFAVVDPEVGQRVRLVFGLMNDGPLAVEALDVGSPVPEYYVADDGAVMSLAPGGVSRPLDDLEPFRLDSGATRDVGVNLRFTGCPAGEQERDPG